MSSINKKINDEIYKICKPHFEKVLQEELSDNMIIFKIAWRPNNYRRQIMVSKKSDTIIQLITKKGLQINNKKVLYIKGYRPRITLQYGKNILTGIYRQKKGGKKEVYVFEGGSMEAITDLLIKHKNRIIGLIDEALNSFIDEFGIRKPTQTITHQRSEDMIKGEEYIDSLPPDLIIHDTYFRKVYKNELEFKSGKGQEHSANYVKNYLMNRVVDNHYDKLITLMEKQASVQEHFDKNLQTHFKVLNKIGNAVEKLERTIRSGRFLSQSSRPASLQQRQLSEYY